MRSVIRTFTQQIVGYYDIESNGSKTVRDFYGRILGYYDAGRDVTTNFNRQIIAYGDITGIFFKDHFNI